MSREAKLPGRYNPYKAALQPSKRDMSGVIKFEEWARTNSPKTYQKLKQEAAVGAANKAYWDMDIDDPTTIDLMDELSALFDKANSKKLTSELTALGLDSITTKRDIRNAYRRKARKLHPDVGGDAEAFKQLHAAYRTLLKEARE